MSLFLYRFDVLQLDGITSSNTAPSGFDTSAVPNRKLYLMTNYEEAQPFGNNEPFASAYLPNLGSSGLSANDGWLFSPERIEHDGLRLDSEKAAGQLTVSLPIDHPIPALYAKDAPGVQVWLTLAQLDATISATPLVIWVGQVVSLEYDEFRCKMTLDHLQAVLQRQGLTAKHSRACPHSLFDAATCGVKAAAVDYNANYFKWREDGQVLQVSPDGLTVIVQAAANRAAGFFSGGFIVIGGEYPQINVDTVAHYPRGGNFTLVDAGNKSVNGGFRRAIVSHDGQTLSLATPLPPGDYTGTAGRVSLFAGCDGELTTCKGKFNNVPRFGGYPYIPIKNPFEVGVKFAAAGTGTTLV